MYYSMTIQDRGPHIRYRNESQTRGSTMVLRKHVESIHRYAAVVFSQKLLDLLGPVLVSSTCFQKYPVGVTYALPTGDSYCYNTLDTVEKP